MGVRCRCCQLSIILIFATLLQLKTSSACLDHAENKYSMYQYLAVARRGVLEFIDSTGTLTANLTEPFTRLHAMAYNPDADRIYLTDSEHENTSIFQVDIATQQAEPLLAKVNKSIIKGIAYDPSHQVLYWTNGRGKTISKMAAAGNEMPSTILEFTGDDDPRGIAVDHCKGYLYWTNLKFRDASIGRSRLDGSERELIVTTGLYQPMSIAVDQWTNRIYWADDLEGQYFIIESSNMDGSDRTSVHRDSHHQPHSLAVGLDSIYWSDTSNRRVWSLSKKGGKPMPLRSYDEDPPMGIAARISTECPTHIPFEIITDHSDYLKDGATTISPLSHCGDDLAYCMNNGLFDENAEECHCAPGYSGHRCEVPACYNYCIHGSCYLDTAGGAQCQCQLGYKGQRCHMDVCEGYCLNGGICNVAREGEPVCNCGQFQGQRCQIDADPTNLNVTGAWRHECAYIEVYRIGLFALVAVLAAMTAAIALLVRKVYKLSKRPRIRKQIIVKKNVTPLTSRPQSDEQCEITIENCCNMNICETPCFEPQLRTSKSKSKTEEKKNLLDCLEESAQEDLY